MEETERLEKSKEETGGTVHTGSVSTAKTEILRFRVTPEERVKIERRALGSCRTISRYLRDCALGKEIVVVPGADSVAEELRRIGNNLNQIARAVNSGGVHAVDLSETAEGVRRVWQSLNSLRRDVR